MKREAHRLFPRRVSFAMAVHRIHICARVLGNESEGAMLICTRPPWGWTRPFPFHTWLNRCWLLSPLALQCHLCSKFVQTCTGFMFPLEDPLAGAKEWSWDQEIFLQGLWGQCPTVFVLEELLHIWINTAKGRGGSFYYRLADTKNQHGESS